MSQNIEETSSGLTRSQLCQFASDLCAEIRAQVGDAEYRGGIYAGNVKRNEDGSVEIGAAAEGVLKGEELIYTAPEMYWNGKRTPAGDVYSVGLLLYYMSEGKLPFESDTCNARKAQQYRMQGNSFNPPVNAGRRLGEIIAKALSFDREKRYRNVGEMKIMLDNCMKNLFLSEEPCAEAVFKKSDDDLSDMERIMVSIMENHDDLAEDMPREALVEEEAFPPAELKESSGDNADAHAEEQQKQPEFYEPEAESEPELNAAETEAESTELKEENSQAAEAETASDENKKKSPAEESAGKASETAAAASSGETKIDLEPINVKHKSPAVDNFPDIAVTTDGVSLDKISKENLAELRRRRRRPLMFILLLCAILIIAAIVFNILTEVPEAYIEPEEEPVQTEEEASEPEPTVEPEPSPEPVEEEPEEVIMISTYEIIAADVSWQEAQRLCENRGGHLAVINDMDEYLRITALLEQYSQSYAWIGMFRDDGNLEWVTGENAEELYCKWAVGEPSGYDGDVPEDYVLMWNDGGWRYNDCVNDPASQYNWYRGNLLYICEIETPAGE